MQRFLRRSMFLLLLGVFVTSIFVTVAFAAQKFIYFRQGLLNPKVEVEDRLEYKIFEYCAEKWNQTDTPVAITQVPGWGHSYCIAVSPVSTNPDDESWYGMYYPEDLQYIFWGRATKFKIELNKKTLLDKSDTFRKSVLVHEFGHAFCLGDHPSTGNLSIMNYDRDRNYLTWPTSDDVAGVKYIYGREWGIFS